MAKSSAITPKSHDDDGQQHEMERLFSEHALELPIVGDVIESTVISALNNEVHLDLNGIAAGVVRGPELLDESGMTAHLNPGDRVTATVIEQENENGEVELSFRLAGHKKAWDELTRLLHSEETVGAEILDANKGGLIVRVGNVNGFLPVSQLTVEHYPRVEGGNKSKILERLTTYTGQTFQVRIIDVIEGEEKLIVSEKAAKEQEQHAALAKYHVGDVVEGKVTGVVDFGAFLEFDEGLEGLVHISELAWQRIDNPKEIINVGETVKAEIIAIEHGKISLSIRRLAKDPWQEVAEKYHVGDTVKGKVLKLNPFGAFVELDADIHGLAHISELSWEKIDAPADVLKIDEEASFKIVSIEPHDHRLGLSLKQLHPKPASMESEEAAPETKTTDNMETAKEEIPTPTAEKSTVENT